MKGAAATCLKRADVACQCNSVVVREVGLQCSLPAIRTRTVGTQLSERRLIYRRSLGVCLSNDSWWLTHISHSSIYNLLLCVWITGVQTKRPTAGAVVGTVETRTAEQSIGGLISTSQKPPPSPPTDWSQPEIEDDDRCVTVVTHLLLHVSLSWRNHVLLSPQCCRNVGQRLCAVRCRVD